MMSRHKEQSMSIFKNIPLFLLYALEAKLSVKKLLISIIL